jgi:hypothetical protein
VVYQRNGERVQGFREGIKGGDLNTIYFSMRIRGTHVWQLYISYKELENATTTVKGVDATEEEYCVF